MPIDPDTAPPPTRPDPAHREVVLDDAGRLAESLPCRSCGYDLKGIASDGVCPECAGAVDRSIRGDLLQFCDPTWLDRLARGLLLIVVGVIGGIVIQLVAMVGSGIAAVSGVANAMTIVIVSAGLFSALVTLLIVIGAWMVTAQDPGHIESEPQLSVRRVARFGIAASLVSAPMEMMMGEIVGGSATPGLRTSDALVLGVSSITAVVSIIGWVAYYIYLRRLVLRVPLKRMARQLHVIMWGYAISLSLTAAFSMTSLTVMAMGGFAPTNLPGPTAAVILGLSIGGCVFLFAYLAIQIWVSVVFLMLRKRLKALVLDARGRWV